MSGQTIAREVRGAEVHCRGTEEKEHDPCPLTLPPGVTVACPVCGRCYRRAASWNGLSGALWPKAD